MSGRLPLICALIAVGAGVRAAESVPTVMDMPAWPTVAPGCIDELSHPGFHIYGEYFKGSLVSAEDDIRETVYYVPRPAKHEYRLRRKFTLPSEPAQAFLQGYADRNAVFRLNGRDVLSYRTPDGPMGPATTPSADVTKALKAGENVLEADYSRTRMYEGGVVAELFVRCSDGSTVRIDSDGEFESSVDGRTWKGVKCLPPAPHPPRITRMTYCDYAHPREFFGGGPSRTAVGGGERIALSYTFGGTPPDGRFFVRVAVRQGGSTFWREEIDVDRRNVMALGADRWRLDIPFEVPLYIPSGAYDVVVDSNSLYCPSARTFGGRLAITAPASDPRYPDPIRAETKRIGDRPVVHLDGRPFPLYWANTHEWKRPDRMPCAGGMPFNAVTVQTFYTDWHPSLGKWDFSFFDLIAESHRRANPDAYFIWDILVYPPNDFARRHPDQMASDEDGDIGSYGRFSWSWASPQAMAELREMVERAVDHVEHSPYANRVIGYRVNSGVTTEWLGWKTRPGKAKDFSEVSRRAYLDYAAKHCPGLKDPHVPDFAERGALDAPNDILWDQRKHMNAIAYMDFNSWIIAKDLLELNGLVRARLDAMGRRKLIGTYYGYLWFLNELGDAQIGGHYALKYLLENNRGVLDFLCSPQSYWPRNLGDTCGYMLPFATLAAHGLMAVCEDDTRTHNQYWPTWADWYQVHTPEQTRALIARNDAVALCHGFPPYHFQLVNGMDLMSPECAEVGRDILKVIGFRLGHAHRRDARIALVTSERSVTAFPSHRHALVETGYRRQDYKADGTVWTRPQLKAPFDGEMCNGAQERFSRCGSTYDLLMAEDLKDNPGDYPLYVFYNLFKYDEATLAAVEKLRVRGATLVWIYAPGWFNGNSLEPMRELTGMTFKETSGGRPVVAMKEDGRLMGQVGATVARRFSPTDADEVLGTYENGEPGLAVKRVGGSRAVFSGAWQLDIAFMRRLAQYAKAHVYVNTDDPVDADESLFTLHARWPGRKTVRLPRKAEAVVDVFGKRIVARNADVFTFDADLHSTHLFYFGEDADRLLAELKKGDVGLPRQVFPEGSLSLFRNVIESTSKRKE